MIKLTRVYTRPNVDILWHSYVLNSDTIRERVTTTYVNTGKLISNTITDAEDELSRIYEMVWIDHASFTEYDSDPELQDYWSQRDIYNNSVGITVGPKILEEV